MADIRINALATTAASTASDDFLAVDGSANGTRKLNAYSPTFGGNLLLSGTTSTITLGSTNTGSIAVDANGALIVTPKAGQYTTLSVSGNSGFFVNNGTTQIYLGNSGGSAVAGTLNANDFLLIRDGAVKLTATATGVDIAGNLTVSGTGGITSSSVSPLLKATTSALGAVPKLTLENTNLGAWNVYLSGTDGGDFKIDQDSTNKFRIAFGTGNVLIGGTSDGGQKLQVSGTAYVSGNTRVGDATGTKLLEIAGSNSVAGAGAALALVAGSTYFGYIGRASYITSGSRNTNDVGYLADTGLGHYFYTNGGTLALTLDSSQNATFAGKVTVNGTDGLLVNKSASLSVITMGDGIAGSYSRFNMRTGSAKYAWSIAAQDIADNALTITPSTAVGGTTFTTPVLTVAQSGAVTVSGAIAIGNTVQTAASVASTHKVTISIGGSTYYLLATNV